MHSIQYSFMNDIVWNKYKNSADQFLITSDIDIWRIAVSSNLNFINHFENILSVNEQARALRFHQLKKDQQKIFNKLESCFVSCLLAIQIWHLMK